MAGHDAASRMWSQQESFYIQVVTAGPPMPTLLMPKRTGSSFSVQAETTVGYTYYLEYKTNLTATDWSLASEISGDGTTRGLTDTTANDLQRFYHVRVQ